MSQQVKKRGLKRTVSNVNLKSSCFSSTNILSFNEQTIIQYNLQIGQYIQVSLEKSKTKYWSRIDIDTTCGKQDVSLSRTLADLLNATVTSVLMIYLHTATDDYNVHIVSHVKLIPDDTIKAFPMLSFVCDSLLLQSGGDQLCFYRNQLINYEFCSRLFPIRINTDDTQIKKSDLFRVNSSTTFEVETNNELLTNDNNDWKTLLSQLVHLVPGYTKQLESFCEYIFSGTNGFRGILLRGESGVGKSHFVKSVLETFSTSIDRFSFENITADLFRGSVGESEKYLRSRFMDAISNRSGTHVIVLEDLLDFESGGRTEKLIITELLYCMEIAERQKDVRIVLVAIVPNQDSIDSSLLRVGRLECEIEITVPAPASRLEIFKTISKHQFDNDQQFLDQVTVNSHGYVAADFVKLVSDASAIAFHETQSGQYNQSHILQAIANMKHSLLLSGSIGDAKTKSDSIRFSDLAGIDDIIQKLQISVIYPLVNKEKYAELGISIPKGVLLRGPPGTGKTTVCTHQTYPIINNSFVLSWLEPLPQKLKLILCLFNVRILFLKLLVLLHVLFHSYSIELEPLVHVSCFSISSRQLPEQGEMTVQSHRVQIKC
jgi:SpoVK/Ycf46/Vps4 family AAA+-type ATPase